MVLLLTPCRHRIAEVLTTLKLLSSMSRGEEVLGLKLSGGFNPKTLLQGTTSNVIQYIMSRGLTGLHPMNHIARELQRQRVTACWGYILLPTRV